jgi:hypothetical protein
MTPDFTFILLCFGLYYLKRWTAGKVMHHPEWQTMDALDRMLHWVVIVGAVWLCVGLTSHYIQRASDVTASIEQASVP